MALLLTEGSLLRRLIMVCGLGFAADESYSVLVQLSLLGVVQGGSITSSC